MKPGLRVPSLAPTGHVPSLAPAGHVLPVMSDQRSQEWRMQKSLSVLCHMPAMGCASLSLGASWRLSQHPLPAAPPSAAPHALCRVSASDTV